MLTIAIPTYNRAGKVGRLLSVIKDEIVSSRLQDQVAVIVSDNASIDETHSEVSKFLNCGLTLEYYRQPENLGFDRNLRFLYTQAKTRYIWYISDDEMPLKGAISKIINVLKRDDPDVLLYSFLQPPDSTVRQFDYPEAVRIITDPVSAIEHVLRYTKLSILVVRRREWNRSERGVLNAHLGAGWYYILLAFSVLQASHNLRLAVISEPLGTCAEDYTAISYSPRPLLEMEKSVMHPFVMKHKPNLIKYYHRKGYCQALQFAFAAKVGSLAPEYPEEYDEFIKELECRIYTLLRHPRSLLQFIALKLRIAGLWPIIRPIIRWKKPLFVSGRSTKPVGKHLK